jgi:hypothetical protein
MRICWLIGETSLKQRSAHGVPDHGRKSARVLFLLGEETSVRHGDIANAGDGGATPMMELSSQIWLSRFASRCAGGRAVENPVSVDRLHKARVGVADRLVAQLKNRGG